MVGSNPYIRLMKKFYRRDSLTPKQISKITKCYDINNDNIILSLLNSGYIEKNTTDEKAPPRIFEGKVLYGDYKIDENKPYRITAEGVRFIRNDTITEDTIKYWITTIIAFLGLILSVYCTFFKT